MASILDSPAVRAAALPITVEQYHRLGEAEIIPHNTELLQGVILEKMVKSAEHSWLVQRLAAWLRTTLPTDWHVRQEQPLTLVDSEPEPDLAVVRGSEDDYRHAHPASAELVIEVAIRSEALDRQKSHIYAAAGVAEYWLVLPQQEAIEVFANAAAGEYRNRKLVAVDQTLKLRQFPAASLSLSELFG